VQSVDEGLLSDAYRNMRKKIIKSRYDEELTDSEVAQDYENDDTPTGEREV
jgi:hypothetical protein